MTVAGAKSPCHREEHCFSPAQYWRFRAEFLLEFWQADPHSIEDLLEGRTLAAGGHPFVLVYREGVEMWSRPRMRFREDEVAADLGLSKERSPNHG